MLRFVKSFLIFIVFYHLLVTIICYGFLGGQYQEIFSLIREGIWILGIIGIMISHRKSLKEYFKVWKYPLIGFGVLLFFGIAMSLFQQKELFDIFVGIKYGFWYLIILLSSTLIGFLLAKTKQSLALQKLLKYVIYGGLIVVFLGFLWQFAKIAFPDFFTRIGYGPLDNFRFGDRPPLYYLTGYEGTLRWQGIFAGPNNYGYYLVAFLPVIINFFRKKTNGKNIAFLLLRVVAILLTLSRSAIVGSGIVVLFLFKDLIKKHRKIALGFFILSLTGLIGLSFLKETSTLAHISAKISSLSYVIDQPLGFGLGSSGPAVHHNGNILPENYFIQLMVDIGTVGFLIWIFCMSQIAMISKLVRKLPPKSPFKGDFIYQIWKALSIGWVALLVMGMFLHVFEDSMVNYIFFIVWGITTGFLSYELKKAKLGILDFWTKRK